MMPFQLNIEAILNAHFPCAKDELIQDAAKMICDLTEVKKIKSCYKICDRWKEKSQWIIHPNGIFPHLVCKKCFFGAPHDIKTNYCPNCGRKMVEVKEDE